LLNIQLSSLKSKLRLPFFRGKWLTWDIFFTSLNLKRKSNLLKFFFLPHNVRNLFSVAGPKRQKKEACLLIRIHKKLQKKKKERKRNLNFLELRSRKSWSKFSTSRLSFDIFFPPMLWCNYRSLSVHLACHLYFPFILVTSWNVLITFSAAFRGPILYFLCLLYFSV
jgi:hypothetical protein